MSIMLKNSVFAMCLISTSLVISACSSPKNTNHNYGKQMPKKYQGNIPTYYTVRYGDTLSHIASRYGLDYRSLGALNGLDSNYTIKVGQRLRLTQPNNLTPSTSRPQGQYPVSPNPQIRQPNTNYPIAPVRPAVLPSTPPVSQPIYTTNLNKWLPPVSGRVIRGFDESIGTKGIWLATNQGSPVIASKDGSVLYVGNGLPEYGNLIMIAHADDYITAYAHLGSFSVSEKQTVKAGQQIGTVGFSMLVNQPAMEFQIRYQGQPINPVNMLK